MMTSWVRRLAPLATGLAVSLGLLLSAGSARAQFDECRDPGQVPFSVYTTIEATSNVLFGELSESVCNAIANKGVSTCKSQVKAAAKCFDRAAAANYAIALKQCKQLADAVDRASCKEEFKSTKQGIEAEIDALRDGALQECDGKFAGALLADCLGGIPL